jgi:DNA-directed RNA polymerase III subunit RPC7
MVSLEESCVQRGVGLIPGLTATDLFPPELRSLLGDNVLKRKANGDLSDGPLPARKRLKVSKATGKSQLDKYLDQHAKALEGEDVDEDVEEMEEEDDDKPGAIDEEDNWSAVSSDSEESGDDYNAEQYFDNGDDDDVDDADPYENTYE